MELEELINEIDIVEYISQFVELTEKNGEFWGLSPFSEERTPSFSVRRESNRFYCFSSGVGGNVFTFVKFYNRCSSREAVEILKKYAGVDGEMEAPKEKMASTLVCKKFKKPVSRQKKKPLHTYPEDCMKKFEIRDDKLQVWEDEGISRESLRKFQVFFDSFTNRLVYPIRNFAGQIVNIGGRTLDPKWKEKNMRKYTYFSGWSDMDVIYGLYENLPYIKEKKEIIIFEGCKSVLLADTWGIHNTGALLTSHLNPNQMKMLAKLGVRVVFALDKEVNVREDHNIQRLKKYVPVEFLWDKDGLLGDKDAPVDKGKDVFWRAYDNRIKLL